MFNTHISIKNMTSAIQLSNRIKYCNMWAVTSSMSKRDVIHNFCWNGCSSGVGTWGQREVRERLGVGQGEVSERWGKSHAVDGGGNANMLSVCGLRAVEGSRMSGWWTDRHRAKRDHIHHVTSALVSSCTEKGNWCDTQICPLSPNTEQSSVQPGRWI